LDRFKKKLKFDLLILKSVFKKTKLLSLILPNLKLFLLDIKNLIFFEVDTILES